MDLSQSTTSKTHRSSLSAEDLHGIERYNRIDYNFLTRATPLNALNGRTYGITGIYNNNQAPRIYRTPGSTITQTGETKSSLTSLGQRTNPRIGSTCENGTHSLQQISEETPESTADDRIDALAKCVSLLMILLAIGINDFVYKAIMPLLARFYGDRNVFSLETYAGGEQGTNFTKFTNNSGDCLDLLNELTKVSIVSPNPNQLSAVIQYNQLADLANGSVHVYIFFAPKLDDYRKENFPVSPSAVVKINVQQPVKEIASQIIQHCLWILVMTDREFTQGVWNEVKDADSMKCTTI
ncbi:unnamed protein product [Anisakis simplex]|uniref:Uncharacterized protein n=1 Tax=Anisakis simplex TaxID=6269 RepID=A0A0M3K2I8_ANISI|nr:unnamed protein product [Anisakis simplex]